MTSLPDRTVRLAQQNFVDASHRQVLLHGINLVDKNPASGYLEYCSPALFSQFREWGFNCIRLGVIWDGLEPEPGFYNPKYLEGLDLQVRYAEENGLVVFLDMHQDLYSRLFSDGAPAWATITDGEAHVVASPVWSDVYFTSPAVRRAFDHFWLNSPAADGIGLQDHYANAWGVLARRYAGNPWVIGYDLMNEPFPGSAALEAQEKIFSRGAEILAQSGWSGGLDEAGAGAGDPGDEIERLMETWTTPAGRSAILQALSDMDVYLPIIDQQQAVYNQFECSQLMGLYQRVSQAIRQQDPRGLLFLETSMASNMGVISAIEPLFGPAGERDPYQVYAPHGYDLVTDTADLPYACLDRVELIFKRHAETAKRLAMPMLVGEWGAFGDQAGTLRPAWQVVSLFENLLCSETFWAYFAGIEHTPSFPAVHRPYPQKICGELLAYHYDPSSGVFSCEWQENGHPENGHPGAPSLVYLPDWFDFASMKARIDPAGSNFQVAQVGKSDHLQIEIPALSYPGRRSFTCQGSPLIMAA
jgi:endoglycosylceramidase